MVKHWIRENKETKFEELSVGDFFCLPNEEGNGIFVKINCFEEGCTDYFCNAVNLLGDDCGFDDKDSVYKIEVPFEDKVTFTIE